MIKKIYNKIIKQNYYNKKHSKNKIKSSKYNNNYKIKTQ